MDKFLEVYKKTKDLHHATFFIGDVEFTKNKVLAFLEKDLKFKTSGNPDFKNIDYKSLSIQDARELINSSERKSVDGKMIFLVSFDFISLEAQNSLLKVIEEPTLDTYFIFISPQDNVIETLKSRMQVYRDDTEESKSKEKSVLDMNMKDRLGFIKEIVDSISDEESTKQDAISLVNKIEKELYKQGTLSSSDSLAACSNAREALFDRGAPVKMILENLVLTI
jgi:DNA polymerase III delta prime subunit